MMYEELVKRLREDKSWIEQGTTDTEHEISEHIQQAADAIEEQQKALDAVTDAHNEGYDVGYWAGRRDYERKWIPVSERLPEPYSGEYLVTINDGSIYTDVLWFDSPGNGRYESVFYKSDDDGYAIICTDVIAWMPLPEPYKEGKNE